MKAGYVYFMRAGEFVKIGVTQNLNRRLNQISPKLPVEPTIIHSFYSTDAFSAEKEMHEVFKRFRKRGEWFLLDDDEITGITSGFYDDIDSYR